MKNSNESFRMIFFRDVVIALLVLVIGGVIVNFISGVGIFERKPSPQPQITTYPKPTVSPTLQVYLIKTDTSVPFPVETHPIPTLLPEVTYVTPVPLQKTPTLEQKNVISTPSQFIRDYYGLINNRKYQEAWTMLSSDFKEGLAEKGARGYDAYTAFWDTVKKVDIQKIEIKSQNDIEVVVYTEIIYFYKKGYETTGHTTYRLIKNADETSWLFN